MARQLKVYRTAIGFFELAIAAPSMKAAAEAWGASADVFSRGFAEQTDDAKIVAAAMAKPGVVLRRPVGTEGAFSEKAALPKDDTPPASKPAPRAANSNTKREVDSKAAEKAKRDEAAAREREQKRLAEEKRRQEAEAARERKRREAIARADAALERAKARHEDALKALAKRRKALDADEADEDVRWEREQRAHEEAVRTAKG